MKMLNNIFQSFCILFVSAILFTSCSEEVEIPLDSTYVRLVVDGAITTDTTMHQVKLSTSGDALNKAPGHAVSNAVVTISVDSNVFVLHEKSNEAGTYVTDSTVFGITGETYTLHITNVDVNDDGILEEYTASSFLPKANPIDSITVEYEKMGHAYNGWLINLYAQEIGGGRNFYVMKAHRNGVLVTDSTYEYINVADNTGFNGKYYAGFPVYTLSKDKTDEKLQAGDVVTLEMDCITQEYKDFIIGFINEYYPKVPIFSGPSANVPTNIEPKDKAVGFFAAYSVHRSSKVYNGE